MGIYTLIQFVLPLLFGIYFFSKDIRKFSLVFFISEGLRGGINIAGIPELRVKEVFYLLMLVYFLSEIFLKKRKVFFDKGGRLVLLLFGLFVLHNILGLSEIGIRGKLNAFFQYFQFLFFLTIIKSEYDWKKIIDYYIFGNIFIIGYAILTIKWPDIFSTSDGSTLIISEYNLRFFLLERCYILFWGALIFAKKRKLLYSILAFIGLVLSGGRNIMIMTIASFVFYYWIKEFKASRKLQLFNSSIIKVIIPLSIFIIFGINYLQSSTDLPVYLIRYSEAIENPEEAGGGRMAYYTNTLEIIEKNVFKWNKLHNFTKTREQYSREMTYVLIGNAHSTPLNYLYTYGVVGLLLLYFMIFHYFFKGIKLYLSSSRNSEYLIFIIVMVLIGILVSPFGGNYYNLIGRPYFLALLSFANLYKLQLFYGKT